MPTLITEQFDAKPSSANLARGLVVSRNSRVQAVIAAALRAQAISSEHAFSVAACEQRLGSQRFEIVFVDSELLDHGLKYLQTLRLKPALARVVLVALTHTNNESSQAFASGAQFCVQEEESMLRVTLDRVLRAAYGFILRERRRYFRCALDVDLILERKDEPPWRAKTVNISEGGICFVDPTQLIPGEHVKTKLRLPFTNVEVVAQCRVQWSAKGRGVGAQFLQMDQGTEQELHEWLATQFEITLCLRESSTPCA
jgi:hypothetical protein